MRKAYKKVLKIFVVLFVLSIFVVPPSYTHAEDSGDDLEQQLEDLQGRLAEIQRQQRDLQSKIDDENSEQAYLQSQITTYNNSIAQTELLIQATETQILLYEAEIDLLGQQVDTTQEQIDSTRADIEGKQEKLQNISFTIYRNSQITSLDLVLSGKSVDDSLFWEHYLSLSKEKGEMLLDELEVLKAAQEASKLSLEAKKTEAERLVAQLETEKSAFDDQVAGLSVMKGERERMLSASKGEEKVLRAEREKIEQLESQINREMEAIEAQLLSRVVSGTHVEKGTTIALMGRTGKVLTCGDNPKTPPVEPCNKYEQNWYYPDPDGEPTRGVHLHFSLFLKVNGNDVRVNPLNYVDQNGFGHPVPGGYITKTYSSHHRAVDFRYYGENLGKPLPAPCSGIVSYSTSYFDADDKGYPGGPFRRDDWHTYMIVCDGENEGLTAFGWHIMSR